MRMRMMKMLDCFELTSHHRYLHNSTILNDDKSTATTIRRCDSRNLNLSPFCSLSSKSPLLKWQPTVIVFTHLIFVKIFTIFNRWCQPMAGSALLTQQTCPVHSGGKSVFGTNYPTMYWSCRMSNNLHGENTKIGVYPHCPIFPLLATFFHEYIGGIRDILQIWLEYTILALLVHNQKSESTYFLSLRGLKYFFFSRIYSEEEKVFSWWSYPQQGIPRVDGNQWDSLLSHWGLKHHPYMAISCHHGNNHQNLSLRFKTSSSYGNDQNHHGNNHPNLSLRFKTSS